MDYPHQPVSKKTEQFATRAAKYLATSMIIIKLCVTDSKIKTQLKTSNNDITQVQQNCTRKNRHELTTYKNGTCF